MEAKETERKDGLLITDNVTWVKRNKNGTVTARNRVHNVVLDDGLEIAVDRVGGSGGQAAIFGTAIGTSNTATGPTQTDLQGSELFRKASTNTQPSSGVERFVTTFAAGEGTGTIEELVLIDTDAASGARKCLCRVLTGSITKGAGDSWTSTYELTASRA